MPTKRLNQTNYAKKLKVSRQSINAAIRSGKIVLHGTGRAAYIDLDCPLTKAYSKSRAVQRHTGKDTFDHGIPVPPSPEDKEIEYAPPSPESIESAKAYHTKQDIERLKKLQETQKLELQNAKSRGELVEREIIQTFVDGMHVIDNAQWKTLDLKVASDVAALLGINDDEKIKDIADIIGKEVINILKLVKREQNKFLKNIGAKKLPKEV